MEKPKLNPNDYQGGKAYGELMEERNDALEKINKEFLTDEKYKDVEELEEQLQKYKSVQTMSNHYKPGSSHFRKKGTKGFAMETKSKFLEFDLDTSGDIDHLGLKQMLEKLGQPKTHLELMKIIKEVDTTGSGTISYREFLWMMLGGKKSILRLILFFENAAKPGEKPHGVPPKRSLTSLP